ncbi:CAP Gly-rich domain-containing protein, partial [Thamnocephalis sphaerospora]
SNASGRPMGVRRPENNAAPASASTGEFNIGDRVRVESMNLEGTLRFLGSTRFKPGSWAGIELDEVGTGKNDGSVAGHAYFSCPPQTGIFVLASKLSQPVDTGMHTPPMSAARSPMTGAGRGLRGPGAMRHGAAAAPPLSSPFGKPLNFRPESRANRYVGMTAQQFKRRSLMSGSMDADEESSRPGTPQAAST